MIAACIFGSRENQTKHAGCHSSLTLAINISIITSASLWGRDINKEAWSSSASSQSALKLGVQVPAIFYWWHIFSQSLHRGELWCWFLTVTDFYPVEYKTPFVLVLVCPTPVKMVGVVKAYSCTAPGHQEVPHTGDTPHCHIKVKALATISWNTIILVLIIVRTFIDTRHCQSAYTNLTQILTLNPCFWKPIISPLKL